MDIISSLATLSFDKRRSEFFSNELIVLLKLIDQKLIDVDTLYGSWAGALGNFQFMPSSIKNYAIDYDKNNKIELKQSLHDAVASAANYINKIGWKYKSLCFYEIELTRPISKKYINTSAKKIRNYRTIKLWKKKGIVDIEQISDKNNKIELKQSLHDAVASAANYINKIGWKYQSLCFYKVELTKPISTIPFFFHDLIAR